MSIGKPSLTKEQIDGIFRKLEPYLKAGLSLYKACLKAQIPKSTVYDLYLEVEEFAEKIDASKSYYSILVNTILFQELEKISLKQKKRILNQNEIKFVQWLALNNTSTKEEYGRAEVRGDKENSAVDEQKNVNFPLMMVEEINKLPDGLREEYLNKLEASIKDRKKKQIAN